MADRDYVEISVHIIWETELAYLVNDGDTEDWLPKSQVRDKEHLRDDFYALLIPEWFATEKGFI